MRIGIFQGATGPASKITDIVDNARQAEAEGFATLRWPTSSPTTRWAC